MARLPPGEENRNVNAISSDMDPLAADERNNDINGTQEARLGLPMRAAPANAVALKRAEFFNQGAGAKDEPVLALENALQTLRNAAERIFRNCHRQAGLVHDHL